MSLDIEAGTLVAQRYRVMRQLGRGGMGEVFAAGDMRTGRTVAVKVLRADSKQKSSAVERFKREARAAGAINSDYVTQVLNVEDDAEFGIVLVFELLEGESLIDKLKRTGPMTFDELFPVVEQVWMGLADAHKSGVIHRDLKPSNVYLERRNDGTVRVKILDFGISKIPKEVGGETLTEMGQSLGTFSFMPPEQIGKAKTVDHRADIYACATLIYQAMSGQLPYAAKNILQMVDLKTKSEPRPLSSVLDGKVDPRLEAFLAKGLAREPDNRFQTANEALDAWRQLRQEAQHRPEQRAPANTAPTAQYVPPQQGRGSGVMQAVSAPMQASPQSASTQSGGLITQQPTTEPRTPYARMNNATVALVDPQSHSASPLPSQHPPAAYNMQPNPQPITQGRMGGTMAIGQSPATGNNMSMQAVLRQNLGSNPAMPAQNPGNAQGGPVAYAGAAAPGTSGQKPNINVPQINDTTSEGAGDQVQTVAIPMRNVMQALGPRGLQPGHQGHGHSSTGQSSPGLPVLHDDQAERGQMGTQLMSRDSLNVPQGARPGDMRASSAMQRVPNSQYGQHSPSQASSQVSPPTPLPGSGPMVAAASQSQNLGRPPTEPNPPSAEGDGLTTVYRRDKKEDGPPPTLPAGAAPTVKKGSRVGMIIGVLAFAVVGFAIAAIVLRYVQTGKFFWQ